MIGQPRADHPGQDLGVQAGQAPADGGLGGHHPVVGSLAAGAQRRPHGCGASAAHSAIAAKERAPVSTAAAAMARIAISGCRRPVGARVADGGQVGQQVRDVGVAERLGAIQLGERGRDRGG